MAVQILSNQSTNSSSIAVLCLKMISRIHSTLYVLLIIFFYDNTDGFKDEPNRLLYSILKCFPVLFLSFSIYCGYGNVKGLKRLFLVGALAAGACGDFLISVCRDMELSFALCAILFGIGHCLYMAGFASQLKSLSPKLTLSVILYGILMNGKFLLPNFGTHPITTTTLMGYSLVLAVALVISGSLALQGSKLQAAKEKNNMLRFIGYLLFFISDSLLLLEHAGLDFYCCKEVTILSTYYTAQYMIMAAAVETEQMI